MMKFGSSVPYLFLLWCLVFTSSFSVGNSAKIKGTTIASTEGNSRLSKSTDDVPRFGYFGLNGGTNTTTGVGDFSKDPLLHSVLTGLHIALVISLIFFGVTGSLSFVCSLTDCRGAFSGHPPGNGHYGFNKRRDRSRHSWNLLNPMAQVVQHSFEKYNDS